VEPYALTWVKISEFSNFRIFGEIQKFDEKSQFDQFYVIGRNFQSDYQIELKFYEKS
jgi:hypothetical protein